MKYLKRFNESVDFEERLKDFCETHLAYLLDEGFEVVLKDLDETYDSEITIKREDERTFTWNGVKDHVVPFIIHLNREYELYKSIGYSGHVIEDIGYIQSEVSSLYEPFSVEGISEADYEPFLRKNFGISWGRLVDAKFIPDPGQLSSIVIYAVIAN